MSASDTPAYKAHAQRVQDLLEANNRLLERARTAEARVTELEEYLESLEVPVPAKTKTWTQLNGPDPLTYNGA